MLSQSLLNSGLKYTCKKVFIFVSCASVGQRSKLPQWDPDRNLIGIYNEYSAANSDSLVENLT